MRVYTARRTAATGRSFNMHTLIVMRSGLRALKANRLTSGKC